MPSFEFSSRFYYITYEVDSPIKQRYRNFITKYTNQSHYTLDQFIELDDMIKFTPGHFQTYCSDAKHQAYIKRRFYNLHAQKSAFFQELDAFNFNNMELVRPTFDTYFMKLAELAASRSNCMKKGNGAIITKDNRVISTGYNGTPFGLLNCNEGGCKRCNDNVKQGLDLDKCLCLHAEESAVMEAGRNRCMGATLYTTSYPC